MRRRPGDEAAIREAITGQLAAFRAGDAEAAFAWASPAIRTKFGTPDGFLTMVKISYEPLLHPGEVLWLELVERFGHTCQCALVVDQHGLTWTAYWLMIRYPGVGWRTNGCLLEPRRLPEA